MDKLTMAFVLMALTSFGCGGTYLECFSDDGEECRIQQDCDTEFGAVCVAHTCMPLQPGYGEAVFAASFEVHILGQVEGHFYIVHAGRPDGGRYTCDDFTSGKIPFDSPELNLLREPHEVVFTRGDIEPNDAGYLDFPVTGPYSTVRPCEDVLALFLSQSYLGCTERYRVRAGVRTYFTMNVGRL